MRFVFSKKKFIPIYFLLFCLAIITLTACSGKGGKIRGVLQTSTLDGVEVTFAAWQTFEYNGTDACVVDQASALNPIALRKAHELKLLMKPHAHKQYLTKKLENPLHFQQAFLKFAFHLQQM